MVKYFADDAMVLRKNLGYELPAPPNDIFLTSRRKQTRPCFHYIGIDQRFYIVISTFSFVHLYAQWQQ